MRINRRLVSFLLVLGPAALFLPGLLRGDALYWGTSMLQFVPWREYAFDVLRSGHLPFWNPYSGMGAPLLANYQVAVFYPPHWMYLFLPAGFAGGLIVLVHLVWAGWGMARLARRMSFSTLAGFISAAAFSLSGYLIARASFLSIVVTAAWLPWIVDGGEVLFQTWHEGRTARRKAVVLLGLVLGVQWLAGHAQTAWYSLIFLGVWMLWRMTVLDTWRERGQLAAALAISGLLGLLLSAVQILPTLEYMLQSARAAGVDETRAFTYSLWPWRLTGLLAPDLFGNPARGGYWGYANYYEDALYIGLLPCLLALFAVVRGWGSDDEARGRLRLLSIIAAVTILLALGWNTPFFPFLYRFVPTFDLFQAPTRWNLLLVFSLSLLAGDGFDRWRPPEGRSLYWTRLCTAGAGIVGAAAYLGSRLVDGVQTSFVVAFAWMGLWMFLAGILSLMKKEESPPWWHAAAIGVILLDLVLAGAGLNPLTPSSVYEDKTGLSEQIADGHRAYMPADVEYHLKFDVFFRFDTLASSNALTQVRETWLPNTNLLDRAPMANNFDPLLPGRYVVWMETLGDQSDAMERRMLQLMDVGWQAVDDDSAERWIWYEPIEGSARVRVVDEAVLASSGDDALRMVLNPDFRPDEEVIVETADAGVLQQGSGGSASIVDQSNPNLVLVNVAVEDGGWLVLSDVGYPGWRASVDGSPVDIYTANYLFRAVWVPPGEHVVQFSYRSACFTFGGLMSLLGLILVAGGLRWRR